MVEKSFAFQNYLEPIDLEDLQIETLSEEDEYITENDIIYGYPFTKEQLLSYLKTEEFLSSIGYDDKKDERNLTSLNLKQIFESIPLERKLVEIQTEKRRRYQAYKSLEYHLSSLTYFDFFSFDSFEIAKNAKFLAQIYEKNEVTLELLFLPFFDMNLEIGKLLKEFGFDENFIQSFSVELETVASKRIREKGLTKEKIVSFIKKISNQVEGFINEYFNPNFKNEIIFNQKIKYSYEVHQLFEKAAENGLSRFKTPIITPEILFITLMEEKNSKVGKKIRKILDNETTWYLIRYKLLKRLYHQEINVRNQVSKNQQFFAYLLKTQLPECGFEKLVKRKKLSTSVALFRNLIIRDVMKENLFDSFDIETFSAILISPKRSYSI